jgi:hypothetical protein
MLLGIYIAIVHGSRKLDGSRDGFLMGHRRESEAWIRRCREGGKGGKEKEQKQEIWPREEGWQSDQQGL